MGKIMSPVFKLCWPADLVSWLIMLPHFTLKYFLFKLYIEILLSGNMFNADLTELR